jgi:hypothetical protein
LLNESPRRCTAASRAGGHIYFDNVCQALDGHQALDGLTAFVDCTLQYNASINASKSELFQPIVNLLGYRVGPHFVEPIHEKLEILRDWPAPTTRKQLQRLLGVFTFHRSFIPDFARITSPLFSKLSTKSKFEWTAADTGTLEQLKQLTLRHATKHAVDENKEIVVYTDAAKNGTAFIFVQRDGENEKVVDLGGYGTSAHEKNYAAHELELLALRHAVEARPDFFNRHLSTVWRTDNQTAAHVLNSKQPLDKGRSRSPTSSRARRTSTCAPRRTF